MVVVKDRAVTEGVALETAVLQRRGYFSKFDVPVVDDTRPLAYVPVRIFDRWSEAMFRSRDGSQLVTPRHLAELGHGTRFVLATPADTLNDLEVADLQSAYPGHTVVVDNPPESNGLRAMAGRLWHAVKGLLVVPDMLQARRNREELEQLRSRAG